MNVWRVVYDSRFSSSSGMEPYHKDHMGLVDLVLTTGDSLHEVKEAIQGSMDCQTKLVHLKKARWLGKAIGDRT